MVDEMLRAFGVIPKVGGSSPLACLQNFDCFLRTSRHQSKMNATTNAHLTVKFLSTRFKIMILKVSADHIIWVIMLKANSFSINSFSNIQGDWIC